MLETNITNIENKDFLKKHDFYDIPGLNEYIISDKKEAIVKELSNSTVVAIPSSISVEENDYKIFMPV